MEESYHEDFDADDEVELLYSNTQWSSASTPLHTSTPAESSQRSSENSAEQSSKSSTQLRPGNYRIYIDLLLYHLANFKYD